MITASTGGGKTEAFLLPLIRRIARTLSSNKPDPPRFILLYPGKAMVQDQIRRVFACVFHMRGPACSARRAICARSFPESIQPAGAA